MLLWSISKPLDGFDARVSYSVVVVAAVVVDIVAHVAKDGVFSLEENGGGTETNSCVWN